MDKKESSLKNMVFTLLVISLVASLALGGIYNLTKEPIAQARKARQEKAIREVIPEFDSLKRYKVMPERGKDSLVFYEGYHLDSLIGTAVETYSDKGFDATPIQLMVGFTPNKIIRNISVIQQKETPGLGTKMKEPQFRDQFKGKDPSVFKMTVKKDGGDVDAITAATISSRAFCDAVNRACKAIKKEGGQAK